MKNPQAESEGSLTPDDDFYLEIESHFAELRGTPFLFSAKDWALMKGWREDGVPLAVVLEAIDQCFEKRLKSKRKGGISSLSYCRHAVKELWEDRKQLQVGAAGAIPELQPEDALSTLAAELESGAEAAGDIGEVMRAIAAEVRQVWRGRSVPEIEEALTRLEQQLLDEITDRSKGEIEALKSAIESELQAYSIEDAVALERTRQAMLRRHIRRHFRLPRLSLFG